MAGDSENNLPEQQQVPDGMYAGSLPSYRRPTTDGGASFRRATTDFGGGNAPIPSRQQTDDMQAAIAAADKPTPQNYVHENPTVPRFVKNSGNAIKYLERNAVCRFVGTVGPQIAHKHRGWFMGCSACLSFTLLLLLIVPLLSNIASAEMTKAFSLGKGEAHWELLIPLDWTNRMYFGLAGMTNITKHGDAYFNKWDSLECTEVFHDACSSCEKASGTVNLWVILGIIVILPAMVLDVHRIFWAADLNFSKMTALILHLGCGVPFAVLALIGFLQNCFMALPTHTIHTGEGRRYIGIDLIWSLNTVTWIMFAILIVRPFPGLLHLLVPTPNWANNRGMKALKKVQGRLQDQDEVALAADMMAPETARIAKELPDDTFIPVRDQSTVFEEPNKPPRKVSAAPSERSISGASALDPSPAPEREQTPVSQPVRETDVELDAGGAASAVLTKTVPAKGAAAAAAAEEDDAGSEEPDHESPRLTNRRATGDDLGTIAASGHRDLADIPNFVDPFEEEHAQDAADAAKVGAAAAPEDTQLPDAASVVTKKAKKATKKKGGTELAATKKM